MAIPEQQLETWSNLGAQQGSANTYASVQTALQEHDWPQGINWIAYLQGSYPNYTNIRGDSDVDVVVESTNVFYNDAEQQYHQQLGLTGGGAYGFSEFRAQVKAALCNYYGANLVLDSTNGKCFEVAGHSSRLPADVVPCITFESYTQATHTATGIALWPRVGPRIVNYPKIHLQNGSNKNSNCNNNYKPNVRVFKNARNRAGNGFPSYFFESLLYNVPTTAFGSNRSATFVNAMQSLIGARDDGSLQRFRCQNEQQLLFGNQAYQIPIEEAHACINALAYLWHMWR